MTKKINSFKLPLVAIFLLFSISLIGLMPPLRIDLTQNKLYTLSDGTLNIINKIEGKPLVLTLFYSNKLTENSPAIRAYARRVNEILREYELRSHGKIVLKVVDPEPFSEDEDRASAFGLQGVPNGNNDTLYFGLVGEHAAGNVETKKEIIAFFNSEKESSLEYDISQLIYRLNQPKPIVVGVISDLPVFQHKNMSSPTIVKPKVILEQLRKMFDIKRMYDNNIEQVDDEIDLLVVIHPRLWPEQTLYAIDQFVLRGGRLLVFMDPNAEMDESENDLFGGRGFQDKSSSLEQLLTAWGVQYDPKKVVLDYHFAHSIPVTRYGQALPHVGVLGIRDAGFNRDEAMTTTVEQVNLASTGAISHIVGSKTQFTMLMQSSTEAQLIDAEDYNKSPNHEDLLKKFKSDNKGPYTIAAYISGPANTSFPNGKPVIKGNFKKLENPQPHPEDRKFITQSQKDISVVLFADTDILDDRMWVEVEDYYGQQIARPWASNSDLIVNIMEKLSGSNDLIHVRSRGSYNRPFERINNLEKIASEQFRAEEENLQSRLAETEKKLMSLTNEEALAAGSNDAQALSPEQQVEIAKFQQERLQIRKKLREVQHKLNNDIDQLGSVLKMINMLAVPIVLSLAALIIAIIRRKTLATKSK